MTGRASPADDLTDFVDRYVAVWNEPDPARRRLEVEALWCDDAVYTNAVAEYRGHDAIVGGITASHDRWVGTGHSFRAGGRTDVHHNIVRFVWNMFAPGDERTPISIGTNFIVLDDRGRIAADHQFLDE